jgi:uncharacterized protein DUF3631
MAADPESFCALCNCPASEPQNNPSPVIAGDDPALKIICSDCRRAARKRQLVAKYPSDLAEYVEALYAREGLKRALLETNDPWTFLRILTDRLVDDENTTDRKFDSREFRQLFIDKLIALPDDAELHVLVGRGQYWFGYESKEVERQIRAARPVEKVLSQDMADPWPEPVDGCAVADEVDAKLVEFLYMQKIEYCALTLWTILTHSYQLFEFAAYLVAKSSEKRCAKTRVHDVVAPMCPGAIVATHMRPETLFRTISRFRVPCFLDEAHLYLKKSEDHELVLNNGFQKGKPIWRLVGDNHEPTQFDIYCPKALNSIGDLQDTIEDRALILHMIRKPRNVTVRPWLRAELIERNELRPIRRRLMRWVDDHAEALQQREPDIPQELYVNDRAIDIWRPLLAIADQLGGHWPERARQAAIMLTSRAVAEAPETEGTELLQHIRSIFYPVAGLGGRVPKPITVMSAAELTERLVSKPEWPWSTLSNGRPLSVNRLARMLKTYRFTRQDSQDQGLEYSEQLKARQQRQGGRGVPRVRGYWREDLDFVFARYLPPLRQPVPGVQTDPGP